MEKKILVLLCLLPIMLFAQNPKKKQSLEELYIIKNDSLTIPLDEVIVLDKREFSSDTERRYYYWYYKKVQKAYPFARIASDTLVEINNQLEGIKSKRKRKKKVKEIQDFMEGEFSGQLKKLTRTEGRILIKLIHRQTGETMYDLIKEYRSGWKAFWYNSSANMFRLSLKKEYKPQEDPLDFIVEDILQRSFINGTLDKREPKIPIDYYKLLNQYHDIDVEQELTIYIDKYLK
ncbi:DUF4294 domain-containing protein [Lutimonas zeaxanthinifaciens]|uniref:DUF4294 domain-containing protein n=1 Tax=Lutimonas zeaxanthinifaciens TaxID=3060215 RepID=UPI00265CA4BE|nr:DUF4294 domain-containing protein [Lutimonas sp. YSD2104]WKK65242.1 DUF4294 domain-containing protein [Lutimonas sp. YSD2104]